MNTFPLRMALREFRSGWNHVSYFIVCVAIGVGAIVVVDSLSENLEARIQQDARTLVAGDVEIRTRRALPPDDLTFLNALKRRNIHWVHIQEMLAMASDSEQSATQLVELKAIENGYPFYGTLNTIPADALTTLFRMQHNTNRYGALVQESLLLRLGLTVGNDLKLGHTHFVIIGTIQHEPDRIAGTFSLGPRVMISREGLDTTQLVQPGSRVQHRYLFHIPPPTTPDTVKEILHNTLTDDLAQIKAYFEVRPRVQVVFQHLSTYLGLLGLITLLIGAVGVAESVRSLMRKRIETIAILKCLGASSRTILAVYLTQALMLSTIGSLLGVACGVLIQLMLSPLLTAFVPVELSLRPAPIAITNGVVTGLITAIAFALWPLIDIKHTRPYVIFRRDVSASTAPSMTSLQSAFRVKWIPAGLIVLIVIGVVYNHTRSITLSTMFLGFVIAAIVLLSLTVWLIVRFTSQLPQLRPLPWRHGLANLSRPGSQTFPSTMSIGLSVMVILTITLIEHDLLTYMGTYNLDTTPSLFFIDIQPDQKEAFLREIASHNNTTDRHATPSRSTMTTLHPLIRSRLTGIDGIPIRFDDVINKTDIWYFTREYVITFMDTFPEHNTLIRGQWWSNAHSGHPPLISIEEDVADYLGVDLGSVIELDVQGKTVRGIVSSVRQVNWNTMTTNFYMIFSPGSLDHTPMTYLGSVRVPADEETALQQRIIRTLPNVTAIRIREILETAATMIQHMTLSIRYMALFCLIVSLIVLSSALAAARYQRLHDIAILKTLGSTRKMIAKTFAVEYAVIGACAAVSGIMLSIGLSRSILHFMMQIPGNFYPLTLLSGLVITVGLTTTVGFLSTYRTLGEKPFPMLREA